MNAGADRLVTITDPRSPAAEAYRTLRANLRFSSLERPLRTVLVTSPSGDEGKTAVLCNLAVTIAQTGSNVIVADCDLRRPSIHRIFDLSNDKGLTTAMLSESAAGALPLQQTAVQNLRALAAGPVSSADADLIGAGKMQQIVDSLASAADIVLFDAPPVGLTADTAILASKLDGVILVVSAGKTRREAAARASALLEKARANILGVVLNNAQLDRDVYGYYDKLDK